MDNGELSDFEKRRRVSHNVRYDLKAVAGGLRANGLHRAAAAVESALDQAECDLSPWLEEERERTCFAEQRPRQENPPPGPPDPPSPVCLRVKGHDGKHVGRTHIRYVRW